MNYLAILAQLINSGMARDQATRVAQQAYQEAQQRLADQRQEFSDVGTPNYTPLSADAGQQGSSAFEGIQVDPAGRQAQLEGMGSLNDIIRGGGLSLADRGALNEQMGTVNQGIQANRKGLENSYAARGQLGGGQQLAMELAAQQQGAQQASQQGESIAAQAQARARQAMMDRAGLGRQMQNDEYGRKSDAARAADLIAQRNAAARVNVGQYNNQLQGHGFDDRMKVANARAGVTGAQNANTLAAAQQKANSGLAGASATNRAIGEGAQGASSAWDTLSTAASAKANDYGDDGRDDEGDGEAA